MATLGIETKGRRTRKPVHTTITLGQSTSAMQLRRQMVTDSVAKRRAVGRSLLGDTSPRHRLGIISTLNAHCSRAQDRHRKSWSPRPSTCRRARATWPWSRLGRSLASCRPVLSMSRSALLRSSLTNARHVVFCQALYPEFEFIVGQEDTIGDQVGCGCSFVPKAWHFVVI